MYASELRTYALGAVVCILLGAGIGVGWHYFADTAGATVVASAATPFAPQDASNPPSPNPSPPRPGPALNVPQSADLSHAQQPTRHNPRKMCTKDHACRKYQAR